MPPPLRAAGPRRHGVTIPRASPQASPAAPPRVPGTPLAADGADPPLLQRALSALFTLPPILSAAAGRARETIRQRGLSVGVDVVAEAEALARAADWASVKASVENAGVRYPPYYLAPFHCYPEGNVSGVWGVRGGGQDRRVIGWSLFLNQTITLSPPPPPA